MEQHNSRGVTSAQPALHRASTPHLFFSYNRDAYIIKKIKHVSHINIVIIYLIYPSNMLQVLHYPDSNVQHELHSKHCLVYHTHSHTHICFQTHSDTSINDRAFLREYYVLRVCVVQGNPLGAVHCSRLIICEK